MGVLMGSDVHVRPYEPADAARVKAITIEGFATVSVDAATDRKWPGWLPQPWSERKWQTTKLHIEGHPEDCFVAVVEGVVVGYVTTTVLPAHGVGHIGDLAVDAGTRGRGIGRRLLEHALDHFRRRGLRLARIATLTHNEIGQHLFPSVGFVAVAQQIHFALPLHGDAVMRASADGGEQEASNPDLPAEPPAVKPLTNHSRKE
jgi:ribosomal protein S18 acetylase RimI-like enzyme